MRNYWPLAALFAGVILLFLGAANALVTVATNDPRDYAPYLKRSFMFLALSFSLSIVALAAGRAWTRWAAIALLLATAYFLYANYIRVPYVWP